MAICGLFTLIAVLLINNSIRLTIYAKRFTIKTMQMVGATKAFIRKPFIWLNIKLGIAGGLLAAMGMGVVLYYLNKTFINLNLLQDQLQIGLLFMGVFVLGLIITSISTFFATQRFLGTNPLQNSLDVHLKANFVSNDKIDVFLQDITSKNFVDEVIYDKPLISLLNDNIKKLVFGFWQFVVCLPLLQFYL